MTQTRDFSRARNRITFNIDGDEFEAASALPAELLLEFVGRFESAGDGSRAVDNLSALMDSLRIALLPESFERFTARTRSRTEPIDLEQVSDIVLWLLEVYGMRPTRRPSSSADGSPTPGTGTSSTGSTSAEASISSPSPPTAS